MNLDAWVTKQVEASEKAGNKIARKAILERLAGLAGVAWQTLEPVTRGARMGNYQKARKVAEATEWAVGVLELCDPEPETMAKRIAEQVKANESML